MCVKKISWCVSKRRREGSVLLLEAVVNFNKRVDNCLLRQGFAWHFSISWIRSNHLCYINNNEEEKGIFCENAV